MLYLTFIVCVLAFPQAQDDAGLGFDTLAYFDQGQLKGVVVLLQDTGDTTPRVPIWAGVRLPIGKQGDWCLERYKGQVRLGKATPLAKGFLKPDALEQIGQILAKHKFLDLPLQVGATDRKLHPFPDRIQVRWDERDDKPGIRKALILPKGVSAEEYIKTMAEGQEKEQAQRIVNIFNEVREVVTGKAQDPKRKPR